MLTTLFAVIAAALAFWGCQKAEWGTGYGIFFAFVSMLAVQVVVMLILRFRTKAINNKIQAIMMEVQQTLQKKQNQFMRRPMGSQKMMMQTLLKDQNAGLQRVIDEGLSLFQPLYKWNFMLKKQVNAMRMAFLFQQKKFDEVDALLPKCVLMDPQSCSIKMVRMFKNNEEGIEKFYKKKCSRMRGENLILPAAVVSWILVKQEKYNEAIDVLNAAKTKTDNEVLTKNWEALVNQKYKQFSNALLGDVWYAMQLEEPKMPRMQQQAVRYR